MAKKIVRISCLVWVMFLTAGMAEAKSEEYLLEKSKALQISGDFAVYSQYIWRGMLLDKDEVVQNGLYLFYKGFSVGIWGSADLQNKDNLHSGEIDYLFDYTYSFKKCNFSVGHTYYNFPETDSFSKEFYIGVGLDTLLAPSLTYYHDYGDENDGGGDGDYVVLEGSYSLPLKNTSCTLDFGGHVAYNNKLFINGKGGDFGISIGMGIPLSDKLNLNPNINYTVPFGDLKSSNDGDQENKFYGGFSLDYSF